MFQGVNLKENLIKYNFFDNYEKKLNIIDDYHTKDIKSGAVNFYEDNFDGIGLEKITIYFQIKAISSQKKTELTILSQSLGVDETDLASFLVFLFTSLNSQQSLSDRLKDMYRQRFDRYTGKHYIKAETLITATLNFVKVMREKGISVEYQPYSSLSFKPPFHGRYWINSKNGLIVDGSLNTVSNGLVFGQVMDEENYTVIRTLFEENIIPNSNGFVALTEEKLIELNRILKNSFYAGGAR